jgi:RND superfamily putative drug exporter
VAQAASGVAAVAPAPSTGGYATDSVDLSVSPYSAAGFRAIAALRLDLARGAPGALVGGSPAAEYDISQAAARDTAVIIPLVLLVILIVIALLLRAALRRAWCWRRLSRRAGRRGR